MSQNYHINESNSYLSSEQEERMEQSDYSEKEMSFEECEKFAKYLVDLEEMEFYSEDDEEDETAITSTAKEYLSENDSPIENSVRHTVNLEQYLESLETVSLDEEEDDEKEMMNYAAPLFYEDEQSLVSINETAGEPDNKGGVQTTNVMLNKVVIKDPKDETPYVFGLLLIEHNDLCYLDINDSESLCIFNGRYWQRIDDDALKQRAYEILPVSWKHDTPTIETLITNIMHFVKREIRRLYNEGCRQFTQRDFQRIQNHIVFQNCVYDVKADEKLGFSKELPYYFGINCDYVEEDFDTPFYDKLKSDATGNDPDSMLMFDLLQAYLLIPNRNGKCFFVMTWAKDAGKTTFGEFIEHYLDDNFVSKIDIENLGGKFSYAGLDRSIIASCLELPMTKLTKSAAKAIKNITGESKLEIEAKYKNRTTSSVRFKLLLATNGGIYLPTEGEADDAFYRRLIVIPFIQSTPLGCLAANMGQKLEKERPYIISKCVRRFSSAISDDDGIVFPESQLSREIKASWQNNSIINENFVNECLRFSADNSDVIPKKDLMMVYHQYVNDLLIENYNERPIILDSRELTVLVKKIFPHVKDKRRRTVTFQSQDSTENTYCMVGIQWTEKARTYIKQIMEEEEQRL